MKAPPGSKVIPYIVLGIGVLFVAFHILVNGASWIKSSFAKIEHPSTYRFSTFDQLLHQVVKGDNVDYVSLKKSPLLGKAVNELAAVAPDKLNSDQERFCFWANSFNLLTLKLLSDHYPIDSPRHLGNAASFTKFTIGGDTYSVRDVTDLKLNSYFKRNPVLSFVVCGGNKGDPPLLDHALLPNTVKEESEKALDNFVNNPANAKYDEVANVFYISPYFQRYDDYFVAYFESPHMLAASRMKKAVPAANATVMKKFTRQYDKRLNDVEREAKTEIQPLQK
jgi:Protein of unknown function, DUF547